MDANLELKNDNTGVINGELDLNFCLPLHAIYPLPKYKNLRTNFKEKNSTGMFISTIPFRPKIVPDISFTDFATKNTVDIMTTFRHQKYSYGNIIEDVRKKDRQRFADPHTGRSRLSENSNRRFGRLRREIRLD